MKKKKIMIDEELFWLLEEKRVEKRLEDIEDLLWLLLKKERPPERNGWQSKINADIGRQARKDVLAVISRMETGKDYNEACREVAYERNVAVQTVYDACTRRLGLSAYEFKEIVSDREKREHLKKTLMEV